jgi:L-alanine-DL-glutamate epimerase-like enolase superfamily enzyme
VARQHQRGGYSFFDPSQSKCNLRRRIETDAQGRYRFRSILPAGYACPPHGVTLVEQPLPAWNVAGMVRLRARSAVPLMADECVFTTHDMLQVAALGAADEVSLELVKHAGLLNLKRVAAVAEAAGIGL